MGQLARARARPAPSSSCSRRRSPGQTTVRASRPRPPRRPAPPAAPPPRCRRRRSSRPECARRLSASAACVARRAPQRAVQRVGRQLGGVALGGAQPAQLARDVIGADPRRREQGALPRTRPTAALPAAIVAPHPLASKPASAIRPSALSGSTAIEMRIRSPQAAPPAAPVQERTGVCPRHERSFEMVDQALGDRHRSSVGATRCLASSIACWIAKVSVRPVSVVVCPCSLTIRIVGVCRTCTFRVIEPNDPTWAARASWIASSPPSV